MSPSDQRIMASHMVMRRSNAAFLADSPTSLVHSMASGKIAVTKSGLAVSMVLMTLIKQRSLG